MRTIDYSLIPVKDYWSTASTAVSCYVHAVFPKLFTKEDIEDLTALVVEKLWKHSDTYDPDKASFATWTGTIARNTVYSEAKAKKRRIDTAYPFDNGSSPDEYTYSSYYGYAHEADAELIAEQTRQEMFNRLHTERDQRIFKWTVQGLTSKEIAEREGIPVKVAYTAVSRMKTIIR